MLFSCSDEVFAGAAEESRGAGQVSSEEFTERPRGRFRNIALELRVLRKT